MARGITPHGGFVAASGSPAFVGGMVGGMMLASAIGTAVETQNNFNDCMFASGWIAVDKQPPAPPASAHVDYPHVEVAPTLDRTTAASFTQGS